MLHVDSFGLIKNCYEINYYPTRRLLKRKTCATLVLSLSVGERPFVPRRSASAGLRSPPPPLAGLTPRPNFDIRNAFVFAVLAQCLRAFRTDLIVALRVPTDLSEPIILTVTTDLRRNVDRIKPVVFSKRVLESDYAFTVLIADFRLEVR